MRSSLSICRKRVIDACRQTPGIGGNMEDLEHKVSRVERELDILPHPMLSVSERAKELRHLAPNPCTLELIGLISEAESAFENYTGETCRPGNK